MKTERFILVTMIGFFAIMYSAKNETGYQENDHSVETKSSAQLDNYSKAYFASGCFWCVEAIFESVRGIAEVIFGYSGGKEPNPTYQQVGGGRTGHAEAVEVLYDSSAVSYETLVQVFYGSHNPTTVNGQPRIMGHSIAR